MPGWRASWILVGLFFSVPIGAQTPVVANAAQAPRDAASLALAAQALAALCGATQVADLKLTGTVTRTQGGEEQGSVTLEATAAGQSRVALALGSGAYVWVRDDAAQPRTGAWMGPDAKTQTMALHNTWTDGAWFLPLLGSMARLGEDPKISLAYAGAVTRGGQTLDHISIARTVTDSGGTALDIGVGRLAAMEIYLDRVSHLPQFLDFDIHPDNNAARNIAVEVVYGDYRPTQGMMMPYTIQEVVGGTVLLDVRLSGVALNTGPPASDFSLLSPTPGGRQ